MRRLGPSQTAIAGAGQEQASLPSDCSFTWEGASIQVRTLYYSTTTAGAFSEKDPREIARSPEKEAISRFAEPFACSILFCSKLRNGLRQRQESRTSLMCDSPGRFDCACVYHSCCYAAGPRAEPQVASSTLHDNALVCPQCSLSGLRQCIWHPNGRNSEARNRAAKWQVLEAPEKEAPL